MSDEIPKVDAPAQGAQTISTPAERHHQKPRSAAPKVGKSIHPYGDAVLLAPTHFARLLYTNPVCILTTCDPLEKAQRQVNAMTISWLTPTTNVGGGFVMSMNEGRFSATLLQKHKRFVLSVPVMGMEETVRRIGRCSGFDTYPLLGSSSASAAAATADGSSRRRPSLSASSGIAPPVSATGAPAPKFSRLGLHTCAPGWRGGDDHGLSSANADAYTAADADDAVATPATTTAPDAHSSAGARSTGATEAAAPGADMAEPAAKRQCPPPALASAAAAAASEHAAASDSTAAAAAAAAAGAAASSAAATPADAGAARAAAAADAAAARREASALAAAAASVRAAVAASRMHGDIAVADCVAHLVCTVAHVLPPPAPAADGSRPGCGGDCPGTPGHLTVFAAVESAWVRSGYWAAGNFAPTRPELPPYLTFYGGGAFGYAATRAQLAPGVGTAFVSAGVRTEGAATEGVITTESTAPEGTASAVPAAGEASPSVAGQ